MDMYMYMYIDFNLAIYNVPAAQSQNTILQCKHN